MRAIRLDDGKMKSETITRMYKMMVVPNACYGIDSTRSTNELLQKWKKSKKKYKS